LRPPAVTVVLLWLLWVVSSSGCADPPRKEMDQAQGAIAAARAAGAEQYAKEELAAAGDSLRRSEEAVTQRDYRLALSLAIEGQSRAQNAARLAGEARAKARGDAERAVGEVDSLLTHARERLGDPAVAALPRRTLQNARSTIASVEKSMQEARAGLKAEDYNRTMTRTKGQTARVQAVLAAIDEALAASRKRPRR
jgi:hypothetical protein